MTKGKMPVFMQALYGTILGVSFYKMIRPGTERLVLYQPDFPALITQPGVFKILLFSVTLMIAAHDWFSYHNNRFNGQGDASGFFRHIPQVFALFFLAEMFVAAEAGTTQYWFIFAFWYTVCNITERIVFQRFQPDFHENWSWGYAKLAVHFGLCIAGFFLTDNTINGWNAGCIGVAFLLVLVIWLIELANGDRTEEKVLDLQSQFNRRFTAYRTSAGDHFEQLLEKIPKAATNQAAAVPAAAPALATEKVTASTPSAKDLTDLKTDQAMLKQHFKEIDDHIGKINASMEKWKEKS